MSVSDEIRGVMTSFIANPPFPKDEGTMNEFVALLADSPDAAKIMVPNLLMEVTKEWITVGVKAAMAYGMLGIDLKIPQETPFIKKLMEG